MNRIAHAFEHGKPLIAFVTGGDPTIETTEKLILSMEQAGADIIEIGIPFSDPVAEGPVIQAASERALQAGCTTDQLFDMVTRVRKTSNIPLLFMTYLNPIYVYGKDRFVSRCREAGIDGLIVPDLPFEEKGELSSICKQYDIQLISMIAPTSSHRCRLIANDAEGFLYCVSSLGVTGMRNHITSEIGEIIQDIKSTNAIPCAIGFGIATPQQAADMASISDGVIIGSAIVNRVAQYGTESIVPVSSFITDVKAAMQHI